MTWRQRTIRLRPRPRGFHLVTDEILDAVPEIGELQIGLAHFFLRHTSASLALNENADPDVRVDMEAWFSRAVREGEPYFRHVTEGPDDMPAHIRSVLVGQTLTIPITKGCLALGTWQGIYLCEHRTDGGERSVVVTLNGEADA